MPCAKGRHEMIGRESLATYLTGVFRVPVDVRAIRRLGGEGQGEDSKRLRLWRAARGRMRRRGRDTPAGRVPHPAGPGLRPRLSGGPGMAGALRPRRPTTTFPATCEASMWASSASRALVSAGDAAEFFQLVEKAEGQLYWLDLDRLLSSHHGALDTERACAPRAIPRRVCMPTSAPSRRSTTDGSASWSGTANA